ncbi:glycine-rich domain-containing protein [Stutzerimonas nitrititolerans]|uniref:glycine-rich domain-containing protein n=1 Tax=Stutzerimonas nitrititolerans TaxID=2482751 RepID=UPI0028AF7801|nr:hypothetical protein [Stutzerimonas nitrititolerans]
MEKVGAYTDRSTEGGEWRAGNPATGQPATPMLSAYFNMLQRELVGLVEAAGIELDIEDDGQLLKAVRALTDGAVLTFSEGVVLPNEPGLFLLDASGGPRTFYMPPSGGEVGAPDGVEVVVRRTDTSANALILAVSGDDRVMLDTTANAAGQSSTELLFAGDYLRLRSDGAGKWWCVGQAQLPASIASGLEVWRFPGVFTWQVPPVLRSGRIKPLGRITGGGGAGSRVNDGAGGGGGAGGTDEDILDLTGVSELVITIGAGGARQPSGVSGMTGGTSSIGNLLSATGGYGATGAGQGVEGGIGVAGKLKVRGAPGESATSGVAVPGAGNGGSSFYAGGGRGVRQSAATEGQNGTLGAGGGGAAGAANAGNGGDGVGEIRW